MTDAPDKTDIAELCRSFGFRLTRPRRAVISVLQEAPDHPDAVELHRRASRIDPDISLATVYRTLSMLQELGLLERHTFTDRRFRYETSVQAHHDHLIDIETGRVTEFHSEEIEKLQEEIARRHGYEIVSHKLEIYVRPRRREALRQR